FQLHARQLRRGALLLALLCAVAVPVLEGPAMQRRYHATARDLAGRQAHWIDGLGLIGPGWVRWLAGMGLGSYPRLHHQYSKEPAHAAAYGLMGAGGRNWLQLAGGSPVYIDQLVAVAPQRRYILSFDARTLRGAPELGVSLCEKWLYSANCKWSVERLPTQPAWRRYVLAVDTPPWAKRRPVKLSLTNLRQGSILAVSNVALRAPEGGNLLANGTFADGMDRWLPVYDNYQPWHLENWWLQMLIEQGACGVLAHVLLLACAAMALLRRRRAPYRAMPAVAAALAAFLTLTFIDSLGDFYRITFVFYLITILTMLQARHSPQESS
ncbi:hypothetical protein, partial [Duganella callida]|uniref:hypothetical protein n=1 Tax=Duganella callida TaxID=2561932 RepID=UPI00197A9557